MLQQGQVFELATHRSDGKHLWPYRYRAGGAAGPDRSRHRALPPHLRSQAHLRHLRPACRHLHLHDDCGRAPS
jgi:hypothetical protein